MTIGSDLASSFDNQTIWVKTAHNKINGLRSFRAIGTKPWGSADLGLAPTRLCTIRSLHATAR